MVLIKKDSWHYKLLVKHSDIQEWDIRSMNICNYVTVLFCKYYRDTIYKKIKIPLRVLMILTISIPGIFYLSNLHGLAKGIFLFFGIGFILIAILSITLYVLYVLRVCTLAIIGLPSDFSFFKWIFKKYSIIEKAKSRVCSNILIID